MLYAWTADAKQTDFFLLDGRRSDEAGAERRAERSGERGYKIDMRGERKFRRSRSAHMLSTTATEMQSDVNTNLRHVSHLRQVGPLQFLLFCARWSFHS